MLKITNITKSFGNVKAVNDLSFTVGIGEILGLLGPNGAGKTTTMRIISGLFFPDTGDVSVFDYSVTESPIGARKLIGYLPENNPLYKDMLVKEFLEFIAHVRNLAGPEKQKALDFAISSVNIGDVFYRPIQELSKGYKQRVGIAGALLHNPKVLILDEPTEGLDPNQRNEIRALIKKLAKEHAIVLSTHVMQEVEAVCSRMVIINKGQKVADGSVEELTAGATKKTLNIDIEGSGADEILRKCQGIDKIELEQKNKHRFIAKISVKESVDLQPELSQLAKKHDWVIWQITEQKQDLEELFRQLTK